MIKNKKGLSEVVTTVLLILLGIAIATIVIFYSRGMLNNAEKDGAASAAKDQCPKKYNLQIAACLNSTTNTLKIEVNNLKEELPPGSLISLIGERTTVLTLLDPLDTTGFKIGEGRTVERNPVDINLTQFGLKRIKVIPLITISKTRALCEDFEEVVVESC